MRTLRRLLSIVLLAVFFLPLVSPLFALSANGDGMVAACCRRNGQHHCAGGMAEAGRSAGDKPALRAPEPRCPYAAGFVMPSSHPVPALPVAEATFAEVVSHPAVHAQTESRWRIARDRSRQKRGPPAFSLV